LTAVAGVRLVERDKEPDVDGRRCRRPDREGALRRVQQPGSTPGRRRSATKQPSARPNQTTARSAGELLDDKVKGNTRFGDVQASRLGTTTAGVLADLPVGVGHGELVQGGEQRRPMASHHAGSSLGKR
jgi:hypothetical protein